MFYSMLAEVVTWGGLVGTILAVALAVRASLMLTPVLLRKAHLEWLRSFSSDSIEEKTANTTKNVAGVNKSLEVEKPPARQALFNPYEEGLFRPRRQPVLRMFDVTLSLVCLGCFFPVFAVVAVLTRIDSPGPVLFLQRRVGKHGREFFVFKFRTMYMDAEQRLEAMMRASERIGPVFKTRQDPRITRVGRILRRYSLDELPQLLNVLRGEMSLVGPRPALPREVSLYSSVQRLRLSVMPGLTGLWQISGREAMNFERSIDLDLDYIKRRSIGLYLHILLMTIPAVLGVGSGSSYTELRRSREDVASKNPSDDSIPLTSWKDLVHPDRLFTS